MAKLDPKLQVEALLFSSGKTMGEEQIATITKLDAKTVKKALSDLQQEYTTRDGALSIFNDATGWKMMVREAYVPVVKNVVVDTELTRACMETLAVIAFKYPKAIQSEVVDIRGSGAYEHMAELERLGFINREPSGRSYIIKLTEKFFNYFDVADGKDIRRVFKNVKIPKPPEQKTLGNLEVVEAKLPLNTTLQLNGMEIVDTQAQSEQTENTVEVEQENQKEPDVPVPERSEPREEHKSFLDDLDRRIEEIAKRNTANDQDETLKRKPLPGMDSQENAENTTTEEKKD